MGTASRCQPPAAAGMGEKPAGRDGFGPQQFMQRSVNGRRSDGRPNWQEEMLWSQQGMEKPLHEVVVAGEVGYLTLKRKGKAREAVGPECSKELVAFSGKGHQGDFWRTSALNCIPVEDLGPST